MQDVVESFFERAIQQPNYSDALFPAWFNASLAHPQSKLSDYFAKVHALLHNAGLNTQKRREIFEYMQISNKVEALCDGHSAMPLKPTALTDKLFEAIKILMGHLYDSLDLCVFRNGSNWPTPRHEFYAEFRNKNYPVCPFCGLELYKSQFNPKRGDFDHYLCKATYPFAAANMDNLIPSCSICNQDFKGRKDILDDGIAFYPYAEIPAMRVSVKCQAYPKTNKDRGQWEVALDPVQPDPQLTPKIKAWDRVYSIKTRLKTTVEENWERWLVRLADGVNDPAVSVEDIKNVFGNAKVKAVARGARKNEPKQIIEAAFYEFMLNAEDAFVLSFMHSHNGRIQSIKK